jgi:hypothetical protein
METTKKTLVKVVITFSDGSSSSLEGEAAKAWDENVNSCILTAFLHGQTMKEHPWKVEKPIES